MKRVFLDATCWVAAAGSETGGSSAILLLAQAFLLVLVTSRAVLQEAEQNIQNKMGGYRSGAVLFTAERDPTGSQ